MHLRVWLHRTEQHESSLQTEAPWDIKRTDPTYKNDGKSLSKEKYI